MKRSSNPATRAVILFIVIAIVGFSIYQETKPRVEVGKLEYRMITGEVDGLFQVVMMETADRFTVMDSAFRNLFTDNTDEVVSRPEQLQLMSRYKNLQYRVGISECTSDEKIMLRTSREMFNTLPFGLEFKYQTRQKQPDSLDQLLEL